MKLLFRPYCFSLSLNLIYGEGRIFIPCITDYPGKSTGLPLPKAHVLYYVIILWCHIASLVLSY